MIAESKKLTTDFDNNFDKNLEFLLSFSFHFPNFSTKESRGNFCFQISLPKQVRGAHFSKNKICTTPGGYVFVDMKQTNCPNLNWVRSWNLNFKNLQFFRKFMVPKFVIYGRNDSSFDTYLTFICHVKGKKGTITMSQFRLFAYQERHFGNKPLSSNFSIAPRLLKSNVKFFSRNSKTISLRQNERTRNYFCIQPIGRFNIFISFNNVFYVYV